jgi:hypothetical protein
MTNFWVKSTLIFSVLARKKIITLFKIKLFNNFMILMATQNGRTNKNFPPCYLSAVVGSGIHDQEWIKIRIQEPG